MTEAAEPIAALREAEQGDHERGCEGRSYTCSCGYDARMQAAATRAANHIETLEARVATLSAALEPFASIAKDVAENHPGWDHDAFEFALLAYTVTLAPFRAAREASR